MTYKHFKEIIDFTARKVFYIKILYLYRSYKLIIQCGESKQLKTYVIK